MSIHCGVVTARHNRIVQSSIATATATGFSLSGTRGRSGRASNWNPVGWRGDQIWRDNCASATDSLRTALCGLFIYCRRRYCRRYLDDCVSSDKTCCSNCSRRRRRRRRWCSNQLHLYARPRRRQNINSLHAVLNARGFDNDGHKPWRPTSWNLSDDVKWAQLYIWR